jgi:hypothetical protein
VDAGRPRSQLISAVVRAELLPSGRAVRGELLPVVLAAVVAELTALVVLGRAAAAWGRRAGLPPSCAGRPGGPWSSSG